VPDDDDSEADAELLADPLAEALPLADALTDTFDPPCVLTTVTLVLQDDSA